ncbi:hypothetical protein HCA61_19945 [Rhodococcus sp. HNM0563]|uniref:hypothetical protein n=1 Tax=Rhodococcus sp. HNM0563 TaxID=2716339 RepID=UPI001469AF8D|nr:hypothetical protein [Rhodococcus sp. HNM0563]NLU64520.1 hypothetical protein [Rhodococcus sp. HNM0563]
MTLLGCSLEVLIAGSQRLGVGPAFAQSFGGNRSYPGSYEGQPVHEATRPLPREVDLLSLIEYVEGRDLDLAEVHPAAARSLRALEDAPSVLAVPHSH